MKCTFYSYKVNLRLQNDSKVIKKNKSALILENQKLTRINSYFWIFISG